LTAQEVALEKTLSVCRSGLHKAEREQYMNNRRAKSKRKLNVMKAAFGFFLLAASAAAETGVRVEVVGGTVPDLPAKTSLRLVLTGTESLVFRAEKVELRIGPRKIITLEYGQNVSRRYAAAVLVSPVFLLSKSRRHYVTLGYVDQAGNQQAVVFQVGKNDIRAVLAALEARTGRRVEYQDNEARKSGKG
jgi:hypothetical protein